MTSILEQLGLKQSETAADNPEDKLGVIAGRLEGLEPKRARLVAAFATVLVRPARSDLHVSEEESARMVEIVRSFGELAESDARLVVELATELGTRQGGTQDYLATRELKDLCGPEERKRLLRCFFAVCAADDSISVLEEEEVRQMAT
ncbi:MAG: TerB family tellurite resistance protein, partial [Acidobacteria bacterium]|nr:TerB family tellurite resistance protein [Candidatus Sulfomarinibacter sp. MAG AM1]